MKTICTVFAGLFLLCLTAVAVNADSLSGKLKGKWIVTVPDAPYGYQNFMLDVEEKDNVLTADITGDADLKDQKFTPKEGKLTANIYVEEYVTVTIWEEEGVIKGSADTSQGKLALNFKKADQTPE